MVESTLIQIDQLASVAQKKKIYVNMRNSQNTYMQNMDNTYIFNFKHGGTLSNHMFLES